MRRMAVQPTDKASAQDKSSGQTAVDMPVPEKRDEFDLDVVLQPEEPKSRAFNVFIMKGSHVIPGN